MVRKRIAPLTVVFLILQWLLIPDTLVHCGPQGNLRFEFSNGYQQGGLRWNIAGDLSGGNPNILSELTWSELKVYKIEGKAEMLFETFMLRALFGYGWVLAGDNQDSDYLLDNRTSEFSRSTSDARGGYLLQGALGIGPRYEFGAVPITVVPLFGFAYHRQALVMTDGVQTISTPPSTQPLGPIAGLNSSYATSWISLSLGVDMDYQISRWVSLAATLSVHPSAYYATADWNLRSDFTHPVSFVHRSLGLGFQGELSLGLEISRYWLVEPRVALEYWVGRGGVDETFWVAGGSSRTQLNEVIWKSVGFSLVAVLRF
ncbi:MAG: hypothetical protein JSV89_12915 [Spirochaetaceae bacterium]|nr:MAG: hypothetical protein JSV89_12915 [Spirochaetaceae bacterium]